MFITFEGGEGSGKSSVIKEILKRLPNAVLTREPGGTPISEQIRAVILDNNNTAMTPLCEALLYAAARQQHLNDFILPAVDAGKIVLCDRYIDSSIVYQGLVGEVGVDSVLMINNEANQCLVPDMTFIFDIEPEIGLARIQAASTREVNRIDQQTLEFHQQVNNCFRLLPHLSLGRDINSYCVIDAAAPLSEVIEEVWTVIQDLLNQ